MKKQLPKISTTSKALTKSLLLAQGVLDQAKNIQPFLLLKLTSSVHELTKNIIAGHTTVSFSHFYQSRIVT